MSAILGEIKLWPLSWAPEGWEFCHGQKMNIREHLAIHSLIGETYGGDGKNYFHLPDFRSRVPVGAYHRTNRIYEQPCLAEYDYPLGGTGGAEYIVPHSTRPRIAPEETYLLSSSAPGGSSAVELLAFNNMPPYLSINYIICVSGGDYPHRQE